MPRNVEDIIPQKKSIRDIPIPEGRRRINVLDAPMQESPVPPPPRIPDFPRREEYVEPPRQNRRGFWLTLGGVVVLALLVVIGLSVFSGATVAYVPRSAALSFASTTFSAIRAPKSEKNSRVR